MTAFKVWAPNHERVRIRLHSHGTDHEMHLKDGGWWECDIAEAGPGDDYAVLLGTSPTQLPDPRSRWQPRGALGSSRLYDRDAFSWSDGSWRGCALPGGVIYEIHLGTFTREGTFDAAIERLDHLVDLGVDLVQLLPVTAGDGTYGWGYDVLAWYAVHEPYGGPDALKRFVDACHSRNLGVLLDLAYGRMSPAASYLSLFGPYLKESESSSGKHLNLDGPHSDSVRRFLLDNALMWYREFHVDGLRVDAHGLCDHSAVHILEELATRVDALSVHLRRPLSLSAASGGNNPRLVTAREAGGYGLTAQFSDDVHNAIHAMLTGERRGHYVDFGSIDDVGKALSQIFVHSGSWSSFHKRTIGRVADPQLPGYRFVVFLQNYDHIGNRAQGDRLTSALSPGQLKIGAALIMSSPFTPLVFMGEEWASSTPWHYFTCHSEARVSAESVARWHEKLTAFDWSEAEMADPRALETYQSSIVDWSEVGESAHADMVDFYQKLIAIRKKYPDLSDPRLDRICVRSFEFGEHRWLVVRRGCLATVCNLGPRRQTIPVDGSPINVVLASSAGFVFSDGEVELDGESVAIVDFGTTAEG